MFSRTVFEDSTFCNGLLAEAGLLLSYLMPLTFTRPRATISLVKSKGVKPSLFVIMGLAPASTKYFTIK